MIREDFKMKIKGKQKRFEATLYANILGGHLWRCRRRSGGGGDVSKVGQRHCEAMGHPRWRRL